MTGNLTNEFMLPSLNTLRPRQNGRHFADDISKHISLNENFWIWNKISLKYVPLGLIDNMAALVQVMAWRQPGDMPLSEAMFVYWCIHVSLRLSELNGNWRSSQKYVEIQSEELSNFQPGGCFTNVSRALQNNLAKTYNARNHIHDENFKLKLCTCVQSMALGTRTKFRPEILVRSTISAVHKFPENILESLRNVSETTSRDCKCCSSQPFSPCLEYLGL